MRALSLLVCGLQNVKRNYNAIKITHFFQRFSTDFDVLTTNTSPLDPVRCFQLYCLPAFITSLFYYLCLDIVSNDQNIQYFLFPFFLIQEPYKFNKNVPPEICQNIKNMLRTYPRLREEQFIFQWFYFPKSRKAEFLYVTYVLHKVRVRVKVISLNTFILCMVNNTFPLYLYNSLI